MSREKLHECPNCNAIWGQEEIDWEHCDCCGWPYAVDDNDQDEEE